MQGKLQFGVFELDCDAMELRKHGVTIRLQEQPLRVLATLVERPGEIVTREELQQHIWGKDTFVDFEQSLNKAGNSSAPWISIHRARDRAECNGTTSSPGPPQCSLRCEANES
ncbi:MAG: winged helix-turn-helix domain-containing protein [Acidobacteriaceae bacterium]